MITELQKKISQAIVNIFETSQPLGDYGRVTVLPGDSGHLTYGRSQTTLASGNLALLLHDYCEAKGQYSDLLKYYLPAFDRRNFKLDDNERVKELLRKAGADPVMQQIQDGFFDRIYWKPALQAAENIEIDIPLGVTVVYNSKIHGSFYRIRDMVIQDYGLAKDIGKKEWIKKYISVRRLWLANHNNVLLHKTVYRMDSLKELVDKNEWELSLPLKVRNVVISEEIFHPDYEPPIVPSAAGSDVRVLFLARPRMRGEDVKRLQRALHFPEKDVDGIFGLKTHRAVHEFQKRNDLKEDGKVGPVTWGELGYF